MRFYPVTVSPVCTAGQQHSTGVVFIVNLYQTEGMASFSCNRTEIKQRNGRSEIAGTRVICSSTDSPILGKDISKLAGRQAKTNCWTIL